MCEKIHTSSDVLREMLEMSVLGREGMDNLVCSVHTVTLLKGKMDEIVILNGVDYSKLNELKVINTNTGAYKS